jgi:hypothetical protein
VLPNTDQVQHCAVCLVFRLSEQPALPQHATRPSPKPGATVRAREPDVDSAVPIAICSGCTSEFMQPFSLYRPTAAASRICSSRRRGWTSGDETSGLHKGLHHHRSRLVLSAGSSRLAAGTWPEICPLSKIHAGVESRSECSQVRVCSPASHHQVGVLHRRPPSHYPPSRVQTLWLWGRPTGGTGTVAADRRAANEDERARCHHRAAPARAPCPRPAMPLEPHEARCLPAG